ncbi:MAG: hypothetical protein KGJ68_04755, partial [Gammaproteobacteria bacterium]|nr:hypothetical protein [Gammaproteobacteria bacterium]
RDLTLGVSDDGKGMDATILASGRPDHWGLRGMRERARSLGAALEVWSRPGAGTDIRLLVPATVAYGRRRRPHPATTLMMRLRRVLRGR